MARDIKAEKRRLTILQLLKDDPDYKINDALLSELLAELGFGVSHVTLAGDLAILAELELISTTELAGVTLAVLRNRGVDVACGTAVVPGVARPRPA
jgi:Fe2+ or Zn2+ uptake regulation protein